MQRRANRPCSECDSHFDRRAFIAAVGGAALAGAASLTLGSQPAWAAPSSKSAAETAVARLYSTLTDTQKKEICFPFDHDLRRRISANWHVTKPVIDDKFYTKEQRELILEVVKNITTPDGYEKLLKQTEYDDGGVGAYSIALFGNPEEGKCQFELTGRHLTLRADGNSVDRAAFGGPIVYGHGEETAKQNLYHDHTLQVNEVFKALDPKQAEKALLPTAPGETAVQLQGEAGKFPGLAVSELSSDQKELFEKTLKKLLSPYRSEDVDEVMEMVKAGGGFDKLHLAFYQQGDLDNDKVWDIWRVEGPSLVWHFRGAPHVHAYINCGLVG